MTNISDAGSILKIRGLEVVFEAAHGPVKAVDGIDLDVRRHEVLGIVGESGSGKTVTALSVLRLIRSPGKITAGSISFDGSDLLNATEDRMRAIRGARISMVFQEPAAALDPVFTAGYQIKEAALAHGKMDARTAKEAAIGLLKAVHVKDPERVCSSYPHQLSGGVRQRVCIAASLINSPELVIMDEPTTALDVTVQCGILDLISEIAADRKISILFISHDLGVISRISSRIAVMRRGRVVEAADRDKILKDPSEEYTRSLVSSARALS